MTRCSGREHPSGLTFAPSTKGRTRCFPNRYCGSRTSIAPNFVCQRSFFHLGDASEGVDECPVPSPRPGSPPKPAAPPVPTDASPPPGALPRRPLPSIPPRRLRPQHDRRNPLPKLRMRSQSRNQRIIAQLQARHPPPPAKSMQTEPTPHRFKSHPPRLRSCAEARSAGRRKSEKGTRSPSSKRVGPAEPACERKRRTTQRWSSRMPDISAPQAMGRTPDRQHAKRRPRLFRINHIYVKIFLQINEITLYDFIAGSKAFSRRPTESGRIRLAWAKRKE